MLAQTLSAYPSFDSKDEFISLALSFYGLRRELSDIGYKRNGRWNYFFRRGIEDDMYLCPKSNFSRSRLREEEGHGDVAQIDHAEDLATGCNHFARLRNTELYSSGPHSF